jgi:phospholipid/cholesterol/gamma-HCH transport system substrate-binding protein
MEEKKEQALVGLFVLIVAALLLFTVLWLTGTFARSGTTYRAEFKFAGGLEPGATVRYAGGPKVGRVEGLRIDRDDPTKIEITFSVKPGTPVKADSLVRIASLSALGDNYLELSPGSAAAPRVASGSMLRSTEYVGLSDLTARLNDLSPVAQQLLQNLNSRVVELQETIARVNDLLNQQNRANLAATLGNVRGMLEEDRPKVKSTLTNIDTATAKLPPLLDDFKKTVARANQAIAHIDAAIQEDRPDLKASLEELRQTLASAESLTEQLDRTMRFNGENIDDLLENLGHVSENLKEFTDTIKARPNTLIFSNKPAARQPGGKPRP